MRDWIKLFEGEVVGFAAPKKAYRDQFTSDEKYRGAGATQASGLTKGLDPNNEFHNHVGELISDYFTTLAAGKEPGPEIQQRAKNIVGVIAASNVIVVSSAIGEIVKAYNEKFPENKIALQYPNPEEHYLNGGDHDRYAIVPRYPRKGDKRYFDNKLDLWSHVINDLLPEVPEAAGNTTVEKMIEKFEQIVQNPEYVPGEVEFDPHAVNDYDLSPFVRKFLDTMKYESRADDEPYKPHLRLDTPSWTGDGTFVITFDSPHGISSKKVFTSAHDADAWVRTNMQMIKAWYNRQLKRDSNNSEEAVTRYIVQQLLVGIRAVLAHKPVPASLIDTDFSWKFDAVKNAKAKNLLQSVWYDLKNERMHEFFSDFHLTWLPEQIKTILAEG